MNRVPLAMALGALMGIGLASRADAVIINQVDTFSDLQYQSASGANGSNNTAASGRTVSVTSGLVATSGRSVFVEKTNGSSNVFLRVESLADDSDSTFKVSRASGIGGNVLVQWDGGTANTDAPISFDPLSNLTHLLGGGSGIDLTAGGANGMIIQVSNADLANQKLTLTLFGASGTIASEQTVTLPTVVAPGTFDALFPFAGFTLRGGASGVPNANAIYAITLGITGPVNANVTLDLLGTYAVPEPATLSLLGIGVVGTISLARRYRARQS